MKNIFENKKIKYVSFDIFDTLVTRRVAKPEGIFLLMQEKISNLDLPQIVKDNFLIIRKNAESLSRVEELYGLHEVNLQDIYSVIAGNYDLNKEQVDYLINLELETEKCNIVPIEDNILLLKDSINCGKNVVLISDMYLTEQQIRYLLSDLDPIFENIKIYVSSEYNSSKRDCGLYRLVQEKEQFEYKNWLHIGDNKISDIKKAKKWGINTYWVKQKDLMPYEELLLSKINNAATQVIVGSARLCKLQKHSKQNIYNFACSFAAPVLYNFAQYVVEESIKRGHKNLYFIARDGYIPKIIADIIIERRNLNIKTKYLYGSRLVWRKPNEENWAFFIDIMLREYKDKMSPELLAYRFGIKPEELCEIIGIDKRYVCKKNTRQKFMPIENKIKFDDSTKSKILELNRNNKEILKEYFKQEIDFNEEEIAFVDLFTSGRTQDFVVPILNEIQNCTVRSFNMSMTRIINREKSYKSAYFASYKYGTKGGYWIELLSRNTEGQTIGYKLEEGKYVPIKEDIDKNSVLDWGFYDYIDGIKEYTQTIIDAEIANNLKFNTLEVFCTYSDYLRDKPDKITSDILGSIPYKAIGKESKNTIAAPKMNAFLLLLGFVIGKNQKKYQFEFLSYGRSTHLAKNIYNFVKKYKNLRHFIFEVSIDKKANCICIRIMGFKFTFNDLKMS